MDPLCATCNSSTPHPVLEPTSSTAAIQQLLSTNKAPTGAERDALLQLIAIEDDPSELEARIFLACSTLSRLMKERAHAKENAAFARRALAPVRRLSDDILKNIFCHLHLQDDLDAIPSVNSLDTQQSPWSLSQVSQIWRRVALSSTRLWSTVFVTFPNPGGRAYTLSHLYKLSLYLHRGRTSLLRVRISNLDTDVETLTDHFLFPILVSSASRWYSLVLNIDYPSLLSLPTQAMFPNLCSLSISTRGSSVTALPTGIWAAPNLQEVIVPMDSFPVVQLPWHQMQTISIRHTLSLESLYSLEPKAFKRWLGLMGKATSFCSSFCFLSQSKGPVGISLARSTLDSFSPQTISLYVYPGPPPGDLLPVDVQTLEDIGVQFGSVISLHVQYFPGAKFTLPRTAGNKLTRLAVTCDFTRDHSNEKTLIEFLKCSPSVIYLTLTIEGLTAATISDITFPGSSALPRLEHLDLSESTHTYSPHKIMKLVEGRRRLAEGKVVGAPLQTLLQRLKLGAPLELKTKPQRTKWAGLCAAEDFELLL